jgi:kynurenine formamidase
MPKREQFFECVFVSDRNEYRFHFRAWNPEAAELLFRDELRACGVNAPGTLHICDSKGQLMRSADYEPFDKGRPAPPAA